MSTEKNKAAQSLGRLGGLAKAARLTEDQRKDAARRMAAKRWAGHVKAVKPAKKA